MSICFNRADMQQQGTAGKEGRFPHPWQPARLIGRNSVSKLSRQAMVYPQISCWSLAQWSRLMTPEQDGKSEEICNLRQGTQATYVSHHLVLRNCTSCSHLWPVACVNGGPPQLGGDETPYKT